MPESTTEIKAVTLTVDPDSRWLYEEAARTLGFELVERPPTAAQQRLSDEQARYVARASESGAIAKGADTLKAIRKHLRDNNLDGPERAYWREAQRRHRAANRG